jgi:hypothetical protein
MSGLALALATRAALASKRARLDCMPDREMPIAFMQKILRSDCNRCHWAG